VPLEPDEPELPLVPELPDVPEEPLVPDEPGSPVEIVNPILPNNINTSVAVGAGLSGSIVKVVPTIV